MLEREREREDRETERQTDRQTERQTHTHIHTHTRAHTHTHTNIEQSNQMVETSQSSLGKGHAMEGVVLQVVVKGATKPPLRVIKVARC